MTRLGIFMLLVLIAGWPRAGLGDRFEDATWAYEAGDYIAAVRLWRPLAKQGDVRAQWVLGLMNEDGGGVARDLVRAHMWYNLAGANGHPKARQSRDALANKMTLELVAEAQDRANEWAAEYPQGMALARSADRPGLNQRAMAGEGEAQFKLGEIYDIGQGAPQDFAQSLKWYDRAARRGNVGARRNLGVMFHAAKGVAQNYAEAAKWLRLAADQGDGEAQMILGGMHERGQGMARDLLGAHMWLNLAGAHGKKAARERRDKLAEAMTPAQIARAQSLARQWTAAHDGNVPPVDVEGVRWRLERARRGDVDQMFLVGMMYDIGHDVKRDQREAARWYLKAAARGHVGAQYNLGAAYYLGYGVAQDYVEAHKWFSIANITGLERAIVNRDIVTRLMTPAQVAEARYRKRD
jgi:TPR repeat protein